MNCLHDIPPGGDAPKKVNVIIEIPSGSRNKYEYDKTYGILKLDRVLYSPVHYPADYGFVPQTLWHDGDPLDILVISRFPLIPGILVEARPIGALEMIDKGEDDIKIIAMNANTPTHQKINEIEDLPHLMVEEIKHFFKMYKELQGVKVNVNKTLARKDAEKAILEAIKMYKEKNKKE